MGVRKRLYVPVRHKDSLFCIVMDLLLPKYPVSCDIHRDGHQIASGMVLLVIVYPVLENLKE